MDILSGLNPAQREAVEAIKGPVLILAGPGSGKTRVITHRIAYLIKTCGVSPRHIMAVTFTNKAAREMAARLNQLVASSVKDITLGTFHAICARILRQDGKAIGVESGFVIYDDDDQLGLIKRCLLDNRLDPKQYAPRAISSAISAAKSQMLSPSDYLGVGRSYFEEVVSRVYERYEQLLKESNALDFDDLLMKTVLLFRSHPDILERYQTRYQHIQVDEFQDTNTVQYELIRQIGGKYRNICVVGDPDQSIYSWRSADIRNILSFEKDYPEAKVVLLEQNYRSTKTILEAASHLIAGNRERKDKGLWTENEAGELLRVVETYTEQEEAQFVVGEIEKLVGRGEVSLKDCAVMYRTNAQSRALEEAFIRFGTAYKLVAGTRFYERREVKDIISYLRLIQNPADSASLLRIINTPARGIGKESLAKLASLAASYSLSQYELLGRLAELRETDKPLFSPQVARSLAGFRDLIEELTKASRELDVVSLFDLVVKRSGYREYLTAQPDGEERWENVLELRTVTQEYREMPPPEGLIALLEGVTLVSDVDGLDETVDAATLITLHQAKGLEFPVVFMVGMEDGILPHIRSMDDPAELEEERRLCYVGITRAKKRVYLVRSFRRTFMGTSNVSIPSRFLTEIPKNLVAGGSSWAGDESKPSPALYTWDPSPATVVVPERNLPTIELKAGDRVRHGVFGEGRVVSAQPVNGDSEVVVTFQGVGVKRLLMSFAKLDKLE